MSDDPSKIENVDLEIFKNEESRCIKAKNEYSVITEHCSHCKRLCAASRYFEVLSGSAVEDKEKKAVFVEFMDTVYHSVIDDTAHFIKEHSEDLERIQSEWTEKYGFAKCSVSKCAKSGRHYQRGRRETANGNKRVNDGDALYDFYESLMDRVHNFMFHLFEIGLRVNTESLMEEIGGDQKEDVLDGVTVDALFAAERDQIRMKRKECKLDLERLDAENNKFTISQSATTETKVTLMDVLFDRVLRDKETTKNMVIRCRQFLDQNSYDSDALEWDIEDERDSNICSVIESQFKFAVDSMKTFIRSTKCRHSLSLQFGCNLITLCFVSSHSLSITQCLDLHFQPDSYSIIGIGDRHHLRSIGIIDDIPREPFQSNRCTIL